MWNEHLLKPTGTVPVKIHWHEQLPFRSMPCERHVSRSWRYPYLACNVSSCKKSPFLSALGNGSVEFEIRAGVFLKEPLPCHRPVRRKHKRFTFSFYGHLGCPEAKSRRNPYSLRAPGHEYLCRFFHHHDNTSFASKKDMTSVYTIMRLKSSHEVESLPLYQNLLSYRQHQTTLRRKSQSRRVVRPIRV